MTPDQSETKTSTAEPPRIRGGVLPPDSVEPRIRVPVLDPVLGEVPPEYVALDGAAGAEGELPTLAEVGKVLPIGFRDQGGRVHREFELADWGWELEEEIGEIAAANPEMPMGAYISEIIGYGVRSLGAVDVSAMPRSRRRLLVSQLYHADALYLYVWIRLAGLGSRVRFDPFACDECGKTTPLVGDLRSLEVKVVEGDEPPEDVVELDRPFRYGKAEVRRVRVAPLRWTFMEMVDAATIRNPAKTRLAVLRHGVVGLEGVEGGAPVVLTSAHAREIGPAGVNRIVGAIDEIGGGAVMECDGACSFCRERIRRTIDWTYGDFFGRSSR